MNPSRFETYLLDEEKEETMESTTNDEMIPLEELTQFPAGFFSEL